MSETLRLTIDSLAHGGDAVARADDGRTVFVTGGCPGDVVMATVTARHERYLNARVAEVVEPSAQRVTPPCKYFSECGGCQWQHVAYETQVAAKTQALADALDRIGGVKRPRLLPTIASGSPFGYRNRIDLTAGADARGGLVLGLLASGSRRVVPIDACLLLPEKCRTYPKSLGGALRYLARGGPLDLHRVTVRVAARTPSVEVDLWAAPGPFPRDAATRALGSAAKFDSLTRVLVRGDVEARDVRRVEVLSGRGYWRERLAGFDYRVSAPSFFQVNTAVAEQMVAMVLEQLEPKGSDRVLDLYAGVGTFTLPLAEIAGEVVAVETCGSAVRDLRRNLDDRGLDAEVVPGDVARALPETGAFDLAVVDPPRSGMAPEVSEGLAAAAPRRIAYVSCDPATLARDAARLTELGYELVSATPLDMFPQTYHVETVAIFDRS